MKEADFNKEWDFEDTPLLWVELIHKGDVDSIKKIIGFSYGGHMFRSKKQTTTFYRNITAVNKIKERTNKLYKDPTFIKDFCKKSKDAEKKLKGIVLALNSLQNKTNKELLDLYTEFFDSYSELVGYYRLIRPEFYAELTNLIKNELPEPKDESISEVLAGKRKISDKAIQALADNLIALGKRRFEMHKIWADAFRDAEKLFEEIGKRINLSALQVKNCTSNEVKEALLEGKKINSAEINERIEHFTFTYLDDNTFTVSFEYDVSKDEGLKREVKGQIANPGIARGNVIIFKEGLGSLAEKMEAMHKGNVLVATNTSPDLMTAIHKASAIVTNEGGLLSHAAVVSREFNIPCIIGTKIATKVFKDGDLVEVDANKGIVRRIKN